MLKPRYTVFLYCMLFLLAACGKYTEAPAKETLLAAHKWKTIDVLLDSTVSVMDPCNNDNTIQFFADSTVRFDYGTIECTPGETRMHEGQWWIETDQRHFYMLGGRYELVTLNHNDLRFWLRDYPMSSTETADIYFIYSAY